MSIVRFGVVGVGGMGAGHCRYISEVVPEAQLTAVCDRNLERAQEIADKYGVPAFDSPTALFQSGLVDAILIATPHPSHASIAIEAFQHGLHVLTEKPLCVAVSEADAVISAWRASGKQFGIVYQYRTRPHVKYARQLIESGAIGEIRRTQLITAWYRTQAYYDSGGWRATWAGEGGGVLINQAPHNIDLFLLFGGMPSKVYGQTRTTLHEIETEDEAFALLEYPNGAHGYLYATTNEEPNENIIEISGDRGKILLCNDQLEVWTLEHSIKQFTYESPGMWDGIPSQKMRYEPEPLPEGTLTEQPAIIQNFARAILYGEPLIAPGEQGLWTMELINAIILSSKRGKPVEVPVDRAEYDALLAELRTQSHPKTRVREQKVTDPKLG